MRLKKTPRGDGDRATVWLVVRSVLLYAFLVLFMPGGIPLTMLLLAKKVCGRKKASGIASGEGSCDEGGDGH